MMLSFGRKASHAEKRFGGVKLAALHPGYRFGAVQIGQVNLST